MCRLCRVRVAKILAYCEEGREEARGGGGGGGALSLIHTGLFSQNLRLFSHKVHSLSINIFSAFQLLSILNRKIDASVSIKL